MLTLHGIPIQVPRSRVYKLLEAFRLAFQGKILRHRDSTLGDRIAVFLYDDLYYLGHSDKLVRRIDASLDVVNTRNQITGKEGRRGDGTFGQVIPGAQPRVDKPFAVRRGPVATLRIGTEVKILNTKKLAQIDRVISDLNTQAKTFHRQTRSAITVGIVGVNFADKYTNYEGSRRFAAQYPPSRDAEESVDRLRSHAGPAFDEFVILRFRATNRRPFPFEWVDEEEVLMQYGSVLVRISNEYEERF